MGQMTPAPQAPTMKGGAAPPAPPPGQPSSAKGPTQPGQPPAYKGAPGGQPPPPATGAGGNPAPAGPTQSGSLVASQGGAAPTTQNTLPQQGTEEGTLAGKPRPYNPALDPNAPVGTAPGAPVQQGVAQAAGQGRRSQFNALTATPAQIQQQIAADQAAGRSNEIFQNPEMRKRFPNWQQRFFGTQQGAPAQGAPTPPAPAPGGGRQPPPWFQAWMQQQGMPTATPQPRPTGTRYTEPGPRQVDRTGGGRVQTLRPADWERRASRGQDLNLPRNFGSNVTAPSEPWYSATIKEQEDKQAQLLKAEELRQRRADRAAARAAAIAARNQPAAQPVSNRDRTSDGSGDGGDGGGDGE